MKRVGNLDDTPLVEEPGKPVTVNCSLVTASGQANVPTIHYRNHFACDWFEDARAEIDASADLHSKRREVLFAATFAECYLYEWSYDAADAKGDQEAIEWLDCHFPKKKSICDNWKCVPNKLRQLGVTSGSPDRSKPDWQDFTKLIKIRNVLVHAHLSQQIVRGPETEIRPEITAADVQARESGWATKTVETQVRKLALAAETDIPDWLTV